VIVDQVVVDLVGQVAVDQLSNPVAVVFAEDGQHLVDREEGRVPLGHEVLHQGQALPGPDDGEGKKDAEQEGGHAGQRHVDRELASLAPDEQRRDRHQQADERGRPHGDLAVEDRCPSRSESPHAGAGYASDPAVSIFGPPGDDACQLVRAFVT
jgi:hypothetical protein